MGSVPSNLCRCKKEKGEYELEINYNDQVSIVKLIQTHVVNFPCGRKPEHPETTYEFRNTQISC